MSGGNTTSSLHFDTHDNLMLQIDGVKEHFLWHPDQSHKTYMDFHNKFGLSPINADRVDLDRFPEFATAPTHYARVGPGDAVYIPDGWWHVIRSHGRNIAVALEFEPYDRDGFAASWPINATERFRWEGLFWEEQTRIKYAMREKLAPTLPSMADKQPITCDAANVVPAVMLALSQNTMMGNNELH